MASKRKDLKAQRKVTDARVTDATIELTATEKKVDNDAFLRFMGDPSLSYIVDRNIQHELMLLKMKDVDKFKAFISSHKRITPEVMWENPLLEKQKVHEQREIEDTLFKNDLIEEGIYQCSRCGCSRTKTESKQFRGGDEGETTTITCVKCFNHWRLRG